MADTRPDPEMPFLPFLSVDTVFLVKIANIPIYRWPTVFFWGVAFFFFTWNRREKPLLVPGVTPLGPKQLDPIDHEPSTVADDNLSQCSLITHTRSTHPIALCIRLRYGRAFTALGYGRNGLSCPCVLVVVVVVVHVVQPPGSRLLWPAVRMCVWCVRLWRVRHGRQICGIKRTYDYTAWWYSIVVTVLGRLILQ